jgi:hypothetical protein
MADDCRKQIENSDILSKKYDDSRLCLLCLYSLQLCWNNAQLFYCLINPYPDIMDLPWFEFGPIHSKLKGVQYRNTKIGLSTV